ncbi:MAG: hypothetical protein ACK56F_10750, partial [bacterium]
MLATGSYDNTARLWDARTGKLVHTLTGHTDYVRGVALAELVLDRDSEGRTTASQLLLATGSYDNTARLWDARTGKLVHTLTGHTDYVRGVALAELVLDRDS